MQGSEISFYADQDDFVKLLSAIEALHCFHFTSAISELNCAPISLSNAMGLILHLRSRHPESPKVFLALGADTNPASQVIKMKDGSGVKIKSDQVTNPDAVLIRLGGPIEDRIIIATSVNTIGETQTAARNFKLLKKVVVSQAVYMNGFYVLPGAEAKLRDGWRLTPDPGFSHELDLIAVS